MRKGQKVLLHWLPNWIPTEAWKGWLEMRRAKHVPNTDRAMRLAIKKLDVLRIAGQNVELVIDQSTISGWTKFYPLPKDMLPGVTQKNTACAHCEIPINGAYTRMSIGKVCDPCRRDYMEGKWS